MTKTTLREFEYDECRNIKCIRRFSDVDASGKGIANDQVKETHYHHDEWGNVVNENIKCEDNKSIVNTFEFDGLGRSRKETKGENSSLKQVSTHEYKGNTVITTLPNQRKECQTLNSQGLIEKEEIIVGDTDKRETRHHYSAKERVRITELPDENKTFEFYDKQQRLQASVSASGVVTEFSYNTQHRYIKKTEYASQIESSALYPVKSTADYLWSYLGYQDQGPRQDLLAKALSEQSKPEFDRVSYTFYGVSDEPRFEIDAKGYLTEYQYNSSLKLTHTIQYKNILTDDEIKGLLSGGQINRKPDRKKDRVTSNFYDNDNCKIGEQDAAGYVTEYIRDAGGRVIEETHYNTANLAVENEFSCIRPSTHHKDAHHYYLYDSSSQCVMEVNEGCITQHDYYPDGKKQNTRRYANKVEATWYKNTSIIPVIKTSEKDEEIQFSYDDLRRLSRIQHPSGEVTTYLYDEMNHQIAKHSRNQNHLSSNAGDDFRGIESRFDAWGQEKAHANEFITQKLAETAAQAEKEEIWNSSSIRAEYDKTGLKIKTIDPKGNVTLYFYDKERRPVFVVDATGAVVENVYNAFGEIVKEHKYYNRIAADALKNLHGSYVNDQFKKLVQENAEKDVITEYKRDKRGQVFEKIDGEGYVSTFKYDAFKQCVRECLPVNEKTPSLRIVHEYESRGLEIKTTKSADGEASIITQKKYEHYLGKQTELIDELGSITEYIHDSVGNTEKIQKKLTSGKIVTIESTEYDAFSRPIKKTDADQITVKFDYDAKNRKTTTTIVGDTSEKIIQKNIFGEILESSVGVIGQKTVLQQDKFTYAPDGQIESHTNGLGKRNKSTFDLLGHKIAEKNASKIKTVYKHNAAYQIESKTVDSKLITAYEPNAFGQDELVTDPRGVKTKNTFDRCGNLELAIHDADKDGLNLVTKNLHNAQNHQTNQFQGDLKDDNQYHEQNEYDSFNRLQATIVDPEGLKIRTEFQSDAAGNVTKETDPMGHVKRTYYDEFQRKQYEITELDDGQVSGIEYEYTPGGKTRSLRTYQAPVSKSAIHDDTSLSDLKKLFKKDNYDTVTLFFQDKKGQDRFKLKLVYSEEKNQFEALVQETLYDAAGRENQTIQYATPLLVKDIHDLTTDVIAGSRIESDKDRVTYRWYDKASQECLCVDQAGHAVEKWYDECGRVKAEISFYESFKNPSEYLSSSAETALSRVNKDSKKDRRVYYVYDAFGRLQYTVKKNGQVIRKDYDENNNVTEVCEFKDVLPFKDNYPDLLAALKTYIPDKGKDIITKTKFDKCNRIESTRDALGEKDIYKRDALGHAKTHIDRSGHEWGFGYDRANRLTEEISPKATITSVHQNKNGILLHADLKDKEGNDKIRVVKKTDYDKANNAETITEGYGLAEQRSCHITTNANKQPTSVSVKNVLVDHPDAAETYKHADLTVLPVQSVTVTTRFLYNTKGKKIAEENANGKWSYYIYDSAERLIYTVENEHILTKYTYNAFGQKDSEHSYAAPVNMDFTAYRENMLIDLKPLLKHPASAQDRIKKYEYDASGENAEIKSAEVFYYSEDKSGIAEPKTKYAYNSFGEVIYEAKLIRPGVYAETYKWRDAGGKIIAQVNENNYLTLYERNANGDVECRTEYAIPLLDVSDKWPVQDLKQKVISSEEDRRYEIEYDKHYHPVSEKICVWSKQDNQWLDPITQRSKKNPTPQFEKVRAECKKKWAYTPTEKLSAITHEDGNKEYRYYDERDILIGETQVTRTNVHGEKEKITPLSLYKLNAFGQTVVTQTSSQGSDLPQENKLPAFINPLNLNEEISLMDNRGLPIIKQDAEQNRSAFTYTLLRKVKRELQAVNIWHRDFKRSQKKNLSEKKDLSESWLDVSEQVSVNANADPVYKGKHQGFVKENTSLMAADIFEKKPVFSQMKYLDEKKVTYNDFDLPETVSWLRDGQVEETIHSKYNVFGDLVAEGLSPQDLALQRKLNSQGHPWFANGEKGEATISLYDLRGLPSLSVRAREDDLSKIPYEQLSEILAWDAKRLERTETIHDKAGDLVALKSPIWFKDKNPLPTTQNIHDRWHNITKVVNSLGHETDYEFNHQNQTKRIIQPEVDVIKKDNTKTRFRPITEFGYNSRGMRIGMKDAQGNVDAFELDEAGQCVTHILADGTEDEKNIFNASGLPVLTYDARKNKWQHEYYKNTLPKKTTYPSGRSVAHEYDGKKGLFSTSHSSGFAVRYNNDVRGNTWESYLPLGQCTRTVNDHNGLPTHVQNPDNTTLTWKRDYFGNPWSHKELGDRIIESDYDYARNLHRQHANCKPAWKPVKANKTIEYPDHDKIKPKIGFTAELGKSSIKDIYYHHAYGQLESLEDIGLGVVQAYENDTEGRRNQVKIFDIGDKTPSHVITTSRDELGRESFTTNQHITNACIPATFSIGTNYDEVNNIRFAKMKLNTGGYCLNCPEYEQTQECWYGYDAVSRTTINNGIKKEDGALAIQPGRGMLIDYENNMRTLEKTISLSRHLTTHNHFDIDAHLKSDVDGRLTQSEAIWTVKGDKNYKSRHISECEYTKSGWISTEKDQQNNQPEAIVSTHRAILNDNQWIKSEISTNQIFHQRSDSKYTYSPLGNPKKIVTKTNSTKDESWSESTKTFDYTGGDTPVVRSAYETIKTKMQTASAKADHGIDVNATINGKMNAADEVNGAYYETTTDGQLLNKQSKFQFTHYAQHNYLHNANMELKAAYSVNWSESLWFQHNTADHHSEISHGVHKGNLPLNISELVIQNNVHATGEVKSYRQNNPLKWDEPNAEPGPAFYTVEPGDSLESIAIKAYGDAKASTLIAKFNGLVSAEHAIKAGHILMLPEYHTPFNKAGQNRPYNQFRRIVMGNLSPHVVFPRLKDDDDDSGFGFFVKIIALAIIAVTAPALAGLVLAEAGIGTALVAGASAATAASTSTIVVDALATGVVAAIGDAAVQGIAIGIGAQSKFSMAEMLETGVSSGVGQGLGGFDTTKPAEVAKRALEIGASVTATQLLEMKIGLRDKFDARAVALQVTSSIASAYIKKGVGSLAGNSMDEASTSMVSDMVSTASNALLGHAVIGTPINMQTMAANAMGSVIGSQMHGKPNNSEPQEQKQESHVQKAKVSSSSHDDKIKEMKRNGTQNQNKFDDHGIANKFSGTWMEKYINGADNIFTANQEYNTRRNIELQRHPSQQRSVRQQQAGFYTEGGMAFGSSAYIAGRTGKSAPVQMTAQEQYQYGEGRGVHIGEEISNTEAALIDGAIIGKSLYSFARYGLFKPVKVAEPLRIIENIADPFKTITPEDIIARDWYHAQLKKIPELTAMCKTIRERALKAFTLRNTFKAQSRVLMKNEEKANDLDPAISLRTLVKKWYGRGVVGDRMWEEIYYGSQRTNENVDRLLGITNDFAKKRSI